MYSLKLTPYKNTLIDIVYNITQIQIERQIKYL